MSSCGFGQQRDIMQLAAATVITGAGWVLQDVLQVVRRWVGCWNVIDGEWVQRWALWRLWLAEIGSRLCVTALLTGRHYSLLWCSGVLLHNCSLLVCASLRFLWALKIFKQTHRCSETLTHSWLFFPTHKHVYSETEPKPLASHSSVLERKLAIDIHSSRTLMRKVVELQEVLF